MRGLTDKTFIVTGAGSGIGAACALRLLEEGANVIGADISETNLARTAVTANAGKRFSSIVFDLGNETSVVTMVKQSVECFGSLHGIVNNAADVSPAVLARDVAVDSFEPDLWRHVFNVTVVGTGIVIRESLPHLIAAGGGAIVNVSSASAWMGDPVRPAYGASKIALHHITRHTANAYGDKNVRCNAIAPGMTLTETGKSMPKSMSEELLPQMCLPRLGLPSDHGALVAFLLSADANWITGQIYSIDGGLIFHE